LSEYLKPCTFCKEQIKMSDNGGKWHATNTDGSEHECKKNGHNGNDISVDVLLKRLASIGITIDLAKLRNAK
jgi:hypothetical protein